MTKEVTMTIRLESDLRDGFAEAAEFDHRPAAQVLRDFMRDYIEKVQVRKLAAIASISSAERKRREWAVNYALGTVAMEGFEVPKEYEIASQKFVRGEISFEELTMKVQEIGKRRK